MKTIPQILSAELNQQEAYIQNVIALLDEGNTIPFIARYRKEAHGAMDDTTLRALETRLQYLKNLQARRDEVKSSIIESIRDGKKKDGSAAIDIVMIAKYFERMGDHAENIAKLVHYSLNE